jgi:hypothetical protein
LRWFKTQRCVLQATGHLFHQHPPRVINTPFGRCARSRYYPELKSVRLRI